MLARGARQMKMTCRPRRRIRLFLEDEHEDDFIGSKRTRVLPKIDSRYNHPALSRSIGR
jgi:hypothetical protein